MEDSKKAAFNLPYSPTRQVPAGYTLFYVSGHTGVDIPTKTASPDIAAQTRKLFANLVETLNAEGLGLDDIVKTTVFLVDMADAEAFNRVYGSMFNNPKPARSNVAVRELPRVANVPLLVEIEAVAAVKPK